MTTKPQLGKAASVGGKPHSAHGEEDATATKCSTWLDPLKRRHNDGKVVGLAEGVRRRLHPPELFEGSKRARHDEYNGDIPLEDDEHYSRSKVEQRPIVLAVIGLASYPGLARRYYTALKIFVFYLISLNSLLTVGLSVGMTFYWHERFKNDTEEKLSGSMDWILLGFAVITPLSLSIGMAFTRRERALIEIAKFRSFAFQVLLSHCIWDWGSPPNGGKAATDVDWLAHADDVLKELIAIGDELYRFLTLPPAACSRHRMTSSGRREAARTVEVSYRLYDSLYTRRFVKLSKLSEKLKLAGLGASEASRIRQYERWMGDAIENLRMLKFYRTPQTLRSFARLFTTLLPPFFAPTFAELAINVDSLAIAIMFAVFASICLNALFSGVEILEDPFVAFLTLDGIDVREEFQVLHYQQLVSARNDAFREARPFGSQATVATASDAPNAASPNTEPTNDSPLTNVSETTHRRRHHRKLTSMGLGDAAFLIGHNDVEFNRESGFQLCANKKYLGDPSSKATQTKTVPKTAEGQHPLKK